MYKNDKVDLQKYFEVERVDCSLQLVHLDICKVTWWRISTLQSCNYFKVLYVVCIIRQYCCIWLYFRKTSFYVKAFLKSFGVTVWIGYNTVLLGFQSFFFQLEQRIKQAFLHYAHIFSQNKLPNVIALYLRCTFS